MSSVRRRHPLSVAAGVAVLLGLSLPAGAQLRPATQPVAPGALAAQTWAFDLQTTGQDVQWTSPTSVDPGAAVYAASYQISLVEVDVQWSFITLTNIDVTGEIPPELQAGSSTLPGPAPVSLVNEPIIYPAPPEPPGISALLTLGLDASGFGFFSATNVALGTLEVDLGGIFGVQTVDVTRVHIVGQLTMHPAWFDLGGALAGTAGSPTLAGDGTLSGGDPVGVTLAGALPNSTATLVLGFSPLGLPFKGGTLVPNPDVLILGLPTGPTGELPLAGVWPFGLPPGFSIFMQTWVADPGGPAGLAASNALQAVTP